MARSCRSSNISTSWESNTAIVQAIGASASTTSLFVNETLTVLPMLIPVVLALISRARRTQWVAGLSYLTIAMGYTILFCSTLS